MHRIRTVLYILLACTLVVGGYIAYALVTTPDTPSVTYGASFNTPYAHELGLPWLEVYTALLDDLQVRHLRLAAHWPMVEPEQGRWDFDELDTQVRMAEERGATIILGVGKRLPRWPECHVPDWAQQASWSEQKELLRIYLRTVVERYKDSPAIEYWQVENEPFLEVYAQEQCGTLDTAFLDEEIALVRSLDPTHPILVTDSGNLGTWYGAYRRGDLFGTSVYVHLYNPITGPLRTILPPATYRVKRALMRTFFGEKPSLLIELSLEPWLQTPIVTTPLDTQLERMSMEYVDEVITYARDTHFDTQYLWGVEWWYWLKTTQNKPEYWEKARTLYR